MAVVMTRTPQPQGTKGSLKWIQRTVNHRPEVLDRPILQAIGSASAIDWRSPLEDDGFAEYRDAAFLERVGLPELAQPLGEFWPRRGPQWDALGRADDGSILMVEAKAHIGELCSPPTQASGPARQRIAAALQETASYLQAKPRAAWESCFYQLTNRLAHLYFLRRHGVPAWLVLVNFLQDGEMTGPATAAEWQAAYKVVWHVLGIPSRHRLERFIVEVYPDVRELAG
jgi:hypothetical protein